jgi:hypothetical protein
MAIFRPLKAWQGLYQRPQWKKVEIWKLLLSRDGAGGF